ncbi:MAG: hypothetical protein M3P34_06535 [Actinomycetota bacterium]|nr:hypothetical protein [Actinomycetota bacterium]
MLRVGDVVVRLVTGTVVGEHAAPLEHVEVDATGRVSLSSDSSQAVAREGRFLEVVAPGVDPAGAELRASAVLGLLAVLFGDQAAGDVVFSDGYRAEPAQRQAGVLRVPVTARVPVEIAAAGFEAADLALVRLFSSYRPSLSTLLALHWFERGVRARTPLDALICDFVGIETVVNAFARERGGVPKVAARKKRFGPAVRKALKRVVDVETYQLLLRSLGTETLRDRFAFFVEQAGFGAELVERFDRLARLRNNAFHGGAANVEEGDAATAKGMLIMILKRELGVELVVPFEAYPGVTDLHLHYFYQDYGYTGPRSSPPQPHPGQPWR